MGRGVLPSKLPRNMVPGLIFLAWGPDSLQLTSLSLTSLQQPTLPQLPSQTPTNSFLLSHL